MTSFSQRHRNGAALLIAAGLLAIAAVAAVAATAAGDPYAYDQPGDRRFVSNTAVLERSDADNRSVKIATPRAAVTATFTRTPVVVDGIREAAWDAAAAYPIEHRFNADMTADAPEATTHGTLRLLWDGPVLYLLVEVSGDGTRADSATPNWNRAAYAPESDGLFVSMDVFNDQWGIETDTQGAFFLGANRDLAAVASFVNAGIPSLGSFFNPMHQDYVPRLKAFRSSGYRDGSGPNYTYEMALQIEGWGDAWQHRIANGTQVGLEIGIADQDHSITYLGRTRVDAGREGNSNLPNGERTRNRDWGVVTLAGWDGKAPFASSTWPAEQDIRFWNSPANPGGGDASVVWSARSRARMVAAKDAYQSLPSDTPVKRREAAAREVCTAFAALRWADAKFPDPHDLPVVHTLPDIWKFFDAKQGTHGRVTSRREWDARRHELLELAQFYEYGYKPRPGEDYTIALTDNGYSGNGNAVVSARVTPTNRHFAGGAPLDMTVAVTLPDSASGQRAPLSLGGNWTANGIASVPFPTWQNDIRSDAGAWGSPNRAGNFYKLFPYARNNTQADSSILIANATAVSITLDVLQMAVDANPQLRTRLDPSRAVTKGFSIGGKNAFVAALFDERVKVAVVGGAGATGPANWRYNAQGQEYDFTGTPFFNAGAERIVAHGTEGPGNSYRHNRVRETELFRHFMPYGHMYAHEEGSYAYGGYSRLPFDQALLVATLAPERAILIDTNLNDYNDGALTDNLSLEIAKGVYRTLGAGADGFVKFNAGNYVSKGDPHGAAGPAVEGRYLADFFFGTHALTDEDQQHLATDPYLLKVADQRSQSPYDFYWGGFNTITGGRGGSRGTNGWYFYKFPPR